MKERHLMREVRRQHYMKLRLAEAQARTGFTVPTRVPVSLEQLQEIEAQLRAHFAATSTIIPSSKLN